MIVETTAARAQPISIHAPREGCDPSRRERRRCICGFQSTHPVRGATVRLAAIHAFERISIHAPREGCDMTMAEIMPYFNISIHAPREGCDLKVCRIVCR